MNKERGKPTTRSRDMTVPVEYKGRNPYIQDPVLPPAQPMQTIVPSDLTKSRRRVVSKPPFHPPFNPRVRMPRPPFDGRDQEYHTCAYRGPPDLVRAAALWSKAPLLNQQPPARIFNPSINVPGIVQRCRHSSPLPRSLPSTMMRGTSLIKVLCAIQLGILAALFSRDSKK